MRPPICGGEHSAANFRPTISPQQPMRFSAAATDQQRLDCVRLMELALGDIATQPMKADVYAGYALNAELETIAVESCQCASKLAAAFPAKDPRLNLELARLLAMLGIENAALLERMAEQLTPTSPPHDDIHYLICLSRLPGRRSELATERAAAGLAALQHKMQAQAMYISRNWPERVGEALDQLYARDAALPARLVAHSQFSLPAQAILAQHMPPELQPAAARKLISAVRSAEGDLRWTDELVALAATLPAEEALPALREAWSDFARRDAILAVLAKSPHTDDRSLLVESLAAVQNATIELAAEGLLKLGGPASESDVLVAMQSLKQACLSPRDAASASRWRNCSPPGASRPSQSKTPKARIRWPRTSRGSTGLPRPIRNRRQNCRRSPRQPPPIGRSDWPRSTGKPAMRSAAEWSSRRRLAKSAMPATVRWGPTWLVRWATVPRGSAGGDRRSEQGCLAPLSDDAGRHRLGPHDFGADCL